MAELVALGVVLVVIALLSWWNASARSRGPGDELAQQFRERGGPLGGGPPF